MQTISSDDFVRWAAARQLRYEQKSAGSDEFLFADTEGENRYWLYPEQASEVPHFVNAIIKALDPTEHYWVYPNRGCWSLGKKVESWPQYQAWLPMIQGLGISPGFIGALCFATTDISRLSALLFLQITLGPSVHIDTYLVPEDGNTILYFSHHDVVHIAFRNNYCLNKTIETLVAAGYQLPTDPPDDTFKPVPWMISEDDESKNDS
ncbi:MAG: hypothetical protein ACLPN1_17375 [Dissulfurispiraceae bacterium]